MGGVSAGRAVRPVRPRLRPAARRSRGHGDVTTPEASSGQGKQFTLSNFYRISRNK